jgi:molybdate transport system ATP-binding protein
MSSQPILSFPQPEGNSLAVSVKKRYQGSETGQFELDTQFEAKPGVTILLGHSGAGKTTILRCVAGLCDPEEGRITLGDRVLFDSQKRIRIEPAHRKVGFVFQDLALFPHLTVRENVAYGMRKIPAAERLQRVNRIMESFQIAGLDRRFPREISGGEQQRVAFARTLVTEPCALLLDEPMSSLDVQTKSSIIDDLRAWNESRRIPILYVTHNHEEVFALGERVIALKQGRVVAEGAPLDVVPKARRETMVQFAGFENLLGADVTRIQEQHGTVVCRLTRQPLEMRAPLTRVEPGAPVHIGIRASEILLASSKPEIVGACNILKGVIRSVTEIGAKTEVLVDCGVDLRVHVPSNASMEPGMAVASEAWLIIQPHFCHLIRRKREDELRRLFLFVCGQNTSRSPLAEAICNAELARRLKVPLSALASMGIQAWSAGVSATPGQPMNEEVHDALETLGIVGFSHRSRSLDRHLVARAEAIFCVTEQYRQKVIEMFPAAAGKAYCLAEGIDLEDPVGQGLAAYTKLAQRIQGLVQLQLEGLI